MPSRDSWHWCGTSVRGRSHVAEGVPNQDAWSVRASGSRVVAAVCDGLGSRREAGLGARAGCRAAQLAAGAWIDRPNAPWELFVRLLHAHWTLLVHPHAPEEAASTCLVVLTSPDGRLTIARLGDGLAFIARASGGSEAFEPTRDGFCNQTTGLGLARSADEWTVHVAEPLGRDDALLLATDGVADDLVPERRHALVRHLVDQCTEDGSLRSVRLRDLLADWPVPHHTDDRTMVLLSPRGSPP